VLGLAYQHPERLSNPLLIWYDTLVTICGRQYLGTFPSREEFAELIKRIRDSHPCPPKGRGKEDKEATNERHVGLLSKWLREIPNIRTIDIDLLAYCPQCWAPLLWIEEKETGYNPDEWQVMRDYSRRFGGHAMFFLALPDTAEIWIYPEMEDT